MQNTIAISIILPMYNAKDTLEECLDSIVDQSFFPMIEVLVVDDASTDSSISTAMKYEERYPDQIAVICLDENAGPGNARNVAMQYARGMYIGFVDADDAIVPAMYEHLLQEALRTGADVVDGGYSDQKTGEAIVFTSDDLTGKLDGAKRSKLIVSGGYNVTKLFRREFLLNEGIVFRNAYVLEDMDYLIEVFAKADSISNVKEIMYIYRDRPESLSKTMETEKYIESTTTAMEAIFEKTSCLTCYEEIRLACEYAIVQLYLFSINRVIGAYLNGEIRKEKSYHFFEKLGLMKKNMVKTDYGQNQYVTDKIKEKDIRMMKINDAYDLSSKEEAIKRMIEVGSS